MNQKIRSIIFGISGLLVIAGAVLYLTHWTIVPYIYAVGVAGVALSYLTIPIKHLSLRVRRLHNLNVIAGLLMIVSSGFMFNNRSEWIICLTIATILQIYSAFASPKE